MGSRYSNINSSFDYNLYGIHRPLVLLINVW